MDHNVHRSDYARFAVYAMPGGAFGRAGAQWLGWDVETGRAVAQDPRVRTPTDVARKYGFHGTLKAPMRLADGCTGADLLDALARVAAGLRAAHAGHWALSTDHGFLALVPDGAQGDLSALAMTLVRDLDRFRAPPTDTELARRRAKGLTPAQDAHLLRWGYPHVGDQFRFHMTLAGPGADVARLARAHFAPFLGTECVIDRIALVGERADGRFQRIEAFTLS